jgi:hypothetical protein
MDVPLWIRLLGLVWLVVVVATLLAVRRLSRDQRATATRVVVLAVSVASVIGFGVVALYARHSAAPVSPRSSSSAGCDTPPAPAPTVTPPPKAGSTPKTTDTKSADAKNTPNFLTFAACGEDQKSAPKRK